MNYFLSKKNPVFFIAEIGGNHEGDFEYAKKLLTLALKSGADAIKFQIYSGDTLVSKIEGTERNKHFKKFELSKTQYLYLADMCRDHETLFMASVWDFDRFEWVEDCIQIHKIGSGDATAFPLIKRIVDTAKPIILSTGLCTIADVRETVAYIHSLDASYISDKKLALLQCTTSYPCPNEEANLNAILLLSDEFKLPVGYSDHTIGSDAALAAAIIGAEIMEMHFTDTREGKTFRDHKISITMDELIQLLDKIRKVKTLLGEYTKNPTASEIAAGHVTTFRRSVYAKCDIAEGEMLSEHNLTILRPEHGISAKRFEMIIGQKAQQDMKAHEVFQEKDVCP